MLKMLFMIVIYAALPGCSFNNSENSITYPDFDLYTTLKVLKEKGVSVRGIESDTRGGNTVILNNGDVVRFVYASSCYVSRENDLLWKVNGNPVAGIAESVGKYPDVEVGRGGNWFVNSSDTGLSSHIMGGNKLLAIEVQGTETDPDYVVFTFSEGSELQFATLRTAVIVCFGDSVTEFGTYPQEMGAYTGTTAYNVGFGGCRMGHDQRAAYSFYDQMSMYKLAYTLMTGNFDTLEQAVAQAKKPAAQGGNNDDNTLQMETLRGLDFRNVDIAVIFYGTNDFSSNYIDLGAAGSRDSSTIKGAMNLSIERLKKANPAINIVFVTPTYRFWKGGTLDADTNPNGLGHYLVNYCDAIQEEAERNGLPCLHMYYDSGIRNNFSTYIKPDGVHPTEAGAAYLAKTIGDFLISSGLIDEDGMSVN
jgi:lysophospholipase L1-like esterase